MGAHLGAGLIRALGIWCCLSLSVIGIIFRCCGMFYVASEKSSAASHREEIAKTLFHHMRQDVETLLHERAIHALALCWGSSSSPLNSLAFDTMKHIVSYLGRPHPLETNQFRYSNLVDVMDEDKGVVFDGLKMANVHKDAIRKLAPGSAVTIPLSSPNLHLTGPCYRDFAKHVRSFDGFHSKRIRVTGSEKYQYAMGGKHSVYWILIVFRMPIRRPPNKTKLLGNR